MRPRSIRVRLTSWYVAVVIVTTTALAAAGVWLARQSVTGAADSTLRAQIEGVRQFIQATSSQMSHDDLVDEFQEYAELTPGQALLQVTDAAGLDLCKPASPGWDTLAARLGSGGATESPTFRSVAINGTPYRAVAATVNLGGRRFRTISAVPMASAEDTMRRFEWALAGLLPCVWVIAAAAGFLVSRRALEPVDRMTREVQAMTVRHLSRRIDVPEADDEIRRLAVTFNAMLARLEAAVAEMARLTGEASHELRTPVALIRATAEVTLSRERSTAEYRQALADVLEHAERMTELVGELLLLARADAGIEAREDSAVDLGQVAASAAREATAAADQRHLTIVVEAAEGVEVSGASAPLRRLCAILIDNALKYTNPGGLVRLDVRGAPDAVVLEVSDTGIGVPAADRERVFDRFYRGPAARERTDGSGLGLAIARSIVTRHHGTIAISSGPTGVGTTVRVRVPRLQSA